jgi:hypothetical protein
VVYQLVSTADDPLQIMAEEQLGAGSSDQAFEKHIWDPFSREEAHNWIQEYDHWDQPRGHHV